MQGSACLRVQRSAQPGRVVCLWGSGSEATRDDGAAIAAAAPPPPIRGFLLLTTWSGPVFSSVLVLPGPGRGRRHHFAFHANTEYSALRSQNSKLKTQPAPPGTGKTLWGLGCTSTSSSTPTEVGLCLWQIWGKWSWSDLKPRGAPL
jgi:hypothetical protein